MSDLHCKPHIISISETKIKDKPLISISLPGYIFPHKISVSTAGGVGVYISDLLQFNEITFKATFPGGESLWINLNSSNNKSSYVIGTVHCHPSTSITNFCEYLNEIFIEPNMQMKHYFVLGDVNTNTKTTNLNSSNFINMLSLNCSTSIIDIPTRVTCTSSRVLDHIITNENCRVIRPIVIDYLITDHFPIMATIDKKFATKNASQKFVRSFKYFDPVKYNYNLQSQFNQFLPQLHTVTENDFLKNFIQ